MDVPLQSASQVLPATSRLYRPDTLWHYKLPRSESDRIEGIGSTLQGAPNLQFREAKVLASTPTVACRL